MRGEDEEIISLSDWLAYVATHPEMRLGSPALCLLWQYRVAERQPDKDLKIWILGGYASALLGRSFGLFSGCRLYYYRKLLPNGRRMYAYSATDHTHGLPILVLAIIMLLLVVSVRVAQGSYNTKILIGEKNNCFAWLLTKI